MMAISRLAIFTVLCVVVFSADAGTLKKDSWTTTACGEKPPAPELDYETIGTFNESVAAMNAWQQESVTYFGCLAKEGSADIKVITDSVNTRQKEYNDLVKKNNEDAAAYKAQMETKKQTQTIENTENTENTENN